MRPSVHACLRNALKFTTWVLLVTGLAIALVAGFLLLEFERARDAADAPAPPPPTPPPAPGLPEAPPTSEIARALATEPWYDRVPHRRVSWSISSPLFRARREHHVKDSLFPVTPDTETRLGVFARSSFFFRLRARRSLRAAAPAASRALTRPEKKPKTPAKPQNRRFLWAFVCVGGYLFITSVVGLSGADFAPRCLCGVDAHRHMLLVAALAQLAVFLALSLNPGADGDALAGLDVTGAEAKLARAVRAHRPLARGVSLAVFALQLADLALASALARARAPPAPGAGGEGGEDAARFAKRRGRRSRGRGVGGSGETRGSAGTTSRGGGNGSEIETSGDPSALGAPLLDRAGDGDEGDDDADDVGASSDAESESAVWARRMRSKYNLDVTRLAYDPERAALRPEPVADRARGKCVVM